MTQTIDRQLLAHTALDILTRDLEGHGNVLSDMHRAALLELLDTFAGYAAEQEHGRRAFPLPTGAGKTSAVVAFIAAVERLGYVVPVSVATSKVDALASIYEDLVAHGVPACRIGIKHSVHGARVESTGSAERLYMLVSHARIRGGSDFDLFGEYHGQRRPLCVWDESLFRSDAFAFSADVLGYAVAMVNRASLQHPELRELADYATEAGRRIDEAVATLKVTDDHSNGIPLTLDLPAEATIEAWTSQLARLRHGLHGLRGLGDVLAQFLGILDMGLWVLTAEGGGVVAARTVVPEALRDVVVLDASGPIRELVHMDPTIQLQANFDLAALKSFEDVEVHQVLAAGGRHAIEGSYKGDRKETLAASLEVVDIIKREREADPNRSFLVFSFLKRDKADVLATIREDLKATGVDPEQLRPDGKRRFVFLHWGMHEALNGFEYCETVILAGVLHRSHLDIAASIKGQRGHLPEPTPGDLVRRVVESEVGHAVYQAASRGSCRRVVSGKAKPMRLYLIHKSLTLRTVLDKVMPGAVWSYEDPRHLKKADADGRTAEMLGRLLEHLRHVPEGTDKVSTRALKAAMAVPDDVASKRAFTKAGNSLDLTEHGWRLDGRSLVRGATAHGFAT